VMPNALAIALVLLLYAAVAGILVARGRNRLRAAAPILPVRSFGRLARDLAGAREGLEAAWPPLPEQTIETLKEDIEWVKHPTRSAAK